MTFLIVLLALGAALAGGTLGLCAALAATDQEADWITGLAAAVGGFGGAAVGAAAVVITHGLVS